MFIILRHTRVCTTIILKLLYSDITHMAEASVASDCETVTAAADARQVVLRINIPGRVYLPENHIIPRSIERTIFYVIIYCYRFGLATRGQTRFAISA